MRPTKIRSDTTVTAMRRSLTSNSYSSALALLDRGAEHLQVGDQGVDLALAAYVVLRLGDLGVAVRHADAAQSRHVRGDARVLDLVREQPRVRRHVRLGHQVARVVQVQPLPLVAVLAADAMQVGAGALAAPLERVVVDE